MMYGISRSKREPAARGRRNRITGILFSLIMILSGFTGFTFLPRATTTAAAPDFTITGGNDYYMEDLVNYSGGAVTNVSEVFYIHANLTVAPGASLTVNASYVLRFDDNTTLNVSGKLVSNGTDGKPVRITSNTSQYFRGVLINSTSGVSYINHTSFSRCVNALILRNTSANLLNVSINDTTGESVVLRNSNLTYDRGRINGTDGGALSAVGNSSVIMSNLSIADCSFGFNFTISAGNASDLSLKRVFAENIAGPLAEIESQGSFDLIFADSSINDTEEGVRVNGSGSVRIDNVTFTNVSRRALSLTNSTGALVEGTAIEGGEGVSVRDSRNISLSRTDILGTSATLRVVNSSGVIADVIKITDAGEGITLAEVMNGSLSNVTVNNVTSYAVDISRSDNLSFEQADIQTCESGFGVVNSSNITVSEFELNDSAESGVTFVGVNNSSFTNVTATNISSSAINISRSDVLTIGKADIRSCGNGTVVSNSSDVTILEYDLNDSSGNGLELSNTTHTTLTDIQLRNCTRTGLELTRPVNVTWQGISVVSAGIGFRVTDFNSVEMNDVKGPVVAGNPNYSYYFQNGSDVSVTDMNVSNGDGSGFYFGNVSNISLRSLVLSSPAGLPLEIVKPVGALNLTMNDVSVSNSAGGLRLSGNDTLNSTVTAINSTFGNYGDEYLNATNSSLYFLNTTTAPGNISMNDSYLKAEFYLSAKAVNRTGINISAPNFVVTGRNGTYKKEIRGSENGVIDWINVTFVEMNATNVTNVTRHFPLNVSVDKWGYETPNQTLDRPDNFMLNFVLSDNQAPDTFVDVIGANHTDYQGTVFVNETARIVLNSFDGTGSGINHTYYNLTWEGGATGWRQYSAPFIPYQENAEGNYTLYYNSTDYENNSEETSSANITVDASPPTFNAVEFGEIYRAENDHIPNMTSSSEIHLNFSDASGMDHYWYIISGIYYEIADPVFVLIGEFGSYPDGEYNILVGAVDNLSHNSTAHNFTVHLDNSEPLATEYYDEFYPGQNEFFVKNSTTFNLTAEDEFSGLKTIYYELDGREYDYDGNVTIGELMGTVEEGEVEGRHRLLIGAEDNLGNRGWSPITVRPSNQFITDNTPPEVSIDYKGDHHVLSQTGTVHVRSNSAFLLSAAEADTDRSRYPAPQSGVRDIWYSLDGKLIWSDLGAFESLTQGIHTLRFGAEDNLGNNGTQSEVTLLLDDSTPAPPVLNTLNNRTNSVRFVVKGKVPADSEVRVMVNFEDVYPYEPDPGADGNFSVSVFLDPGENVITAYTVDYFGRLSVTTPPHKVILDTQAPYVTGSVPERKATGVSPKTTVTVTFNEPLNDIDISVIYRTVDGNGIPQWNQVRGTTYYTPWAKQAMFVPKNDLGKEMSYRIEVDMYDTANNFNRSRLYDIHDGSSFSFKTMTTTHIYNEYDITISAQKINITYEKLGEKIPRAELHKKFKQSPAPPPDDHISFNVFFELTLNDDVSWAEITLDYTIQSAAFSSEVIEKLRDPERADMTELSFYKLSAGEWEKLKSEQLSAHKIRYIWNSSENGTLTLGAFLPDLDWDSDGYPNSKDLFPRDPKNWADGDGDGYGDESDAFPENSLYWKDGDEDGMPDGWERKYGLDPFSMTDMNDDMDQDGLENLREFEAGTHPGIYDTDEDGMPDGWEIDYSLDPTNKSGAKLDPDGDGATNLEEYRQGRNPLVSDSSKEGGAGRYATVIVILIALVIVGGVVSYVYFFKRSKKEEEEEDEYYDLDELGAVEFPEDVSWDEGPKEVEPLEVFDIDDMDRLWRPGEISPEAGWSKAGAPFPGREEKKPDIPEEMLFSVADVECSECGGTVEPDDTECPECGLTFEEEPEPEGDLETELMEELLKNLEIVNCSECGGHVERADALCGECGAHFVEKGELVCTSCDGAVADDEEKCPHCGAVFK